MKLPNAMLNTLTATFLSATFLSTTLLSTEALAAEKAPKQVTLDAVPESVREQNTLSPEEQERQRATEKKAASEFDAAVNAAKQRASTPR